MLFYNIEITCMGAATVVVGTRRDGGGKAAHSGSYWLKPAKNKFTQSYFTSFLCKLNYIIVYLCFVVSYFARGFRDNLVNNLRDNVWNSN